MVKDFLINIKKVNLIAFTIGIVYLWFGILKFFPNLSPAEELAKNTVNVLTFELIPSNVSFFMLAIWETLIGVLLIVNVYNRAVLTFALIHMICTFTPLFFFPNLAFNDIPFSLTLVGQYITKNIIIVGALIILFKEHKRQLKFISIKD